MPHQVGIFVFKNDLRLHDNPALAKAAAEVDELICIYCLEAKQPVSSLRAPSNLSSHRLHFLHQSLSGLHTSLLTLGQQLLVSAKSPLDVIPQLITQHNVAKIYCSQNVGDYENRIWGKLSKRYPMIGFESIASHTLFTESELPFNVADLPDSFSKFRKAVEPLTIKPPIAEINSLPASPDIEWEWPQSRTSQISQPLFEGGEQQGQPESKKTKARDALLAEPA